MILEGAIGDAYGAGFEFADRAYITKNNDLTKYVPSTSASSYQQLKQNTILIQALKINPRQFHPLHQLAIVSSIL